MPKRFALVNDTKGRWFLRRMRSATHDLLRDEKVYHCDKHLGGPFDTVFGAIHLIGKATHAPRKKKRALKKGQS